MEASKSIDFTSFEDVLPPEQFLNMDGFTVQRTFENKSNQIIVIKNRFNMPIVCSPTPAGDKDQGIYVIDTFKIKTDALVKLKEYYQYVVTFNDPYLDKIRASILKTETGIIAGYVSFSIVGFISIANFANDEILYNMRYDILISTKHDLKAIPDHPYSTVSMFRTNYEEYTKPAMTTGVSIFIIDKHNLIDKRYAYLHGEVVDIPIIRDSVKSDGIYIQRHYGVGQDVVTEYKHFDLTQPSSVTHVYTSREDAISQGNTESTNKAELARITREISENKLAYEKEKQDYEMKIMKLKAEHDIAIATLKNQSEKASSERKEASEKRQTVMEILKFVPAIVGAVVSIVVIYDKLKGDK